MIIGGGLLQVPLIRTAKEMGLQVIVTDYNAEAPGLVYADIPVIMSTRDVDGSVRIAKKQHKCTPISGVLTSGTDASMTVAAVANALGLPGIKFEDAEAATNKIKMRTRFKQHHVPSPEFAPVWSLAEAKDACRKLGLPLVIKPADNMGARGVMCIDNKNMISEAFHGAKAASPSGELIIERFMEGPELSIDSIVFEGEVTFTGIADRIIEDHPYFIEKGHTMPSMMDTEIIDEAKRVMCAGIKALGITHGFAKGDIKVTPEGVKIGELAARLSGGFMSTHTFPYSTGVNLMKAAIEISLGLEPGNLEPVKNLVSIERAIITPPGVVKDISGIDEAKGVAYINDIFLNVVPGDQIIKPKSNVDKAGHIIATAPTLALAEKAVEEAKKKIRITITSEDELSLPLVYARAREKFNKACVVCRECDGVNCASGVPGMGAVGSGESFVRNITSLREYRVMTRLIHTVNEPDTSVDFFGYKLSIPVIAAPITGAVTNLNGAIEEMQYAKAVVNGCASIGSLGMVGDGATPEKYLLGLEAIRLAGGRGIPVFKPRKNTEDILVRFEKAREAGCPAVGMDIDAVSFTTMDKKAQGTAARDCDELSDLVKKAGLPLILKGIMSVEDALLAKKAGAAAIIVSNHGGRVLDYMPGTMDVLSKIREALPDMLIIADGGFRSGLDVLKGIAAGANIISIGRPVCISAVGMHEKGVQLYLETIKKELMKAMVLTGSASVSAVSEKILIRPQK